MDHPDDVLARFDFVVASVHGRFRLDKKEQTVPKDRVMLAADYVFWPAVLLMLAANLYYGPRIKSGRIAMQWGLDGKPTWYAPKPIALWGALASALAVRLLIWAAMTYMPDIVHGPEIGLLLFSVTVAAAHLWVLLAAARAG